MKFLITLVLLLNIFITPAQAVEATDSSDQQKDIINLIQQKVKEKLNLIATPSAKPKSFVGTITKIDDQQIDISYKNQSQTVSIDPEATYIDTKRRKSKLSDFKVGQDIIAMGYLNQQSQISGKRIVAIDLKSIENQKEVVLGKIVDISQSSPIMTIIPVKNKNTQYQITNDSYTKILDKDNNKIKSTDISVGHKVIAVIKPDPKITNTFYVSKIIDLDYNPESPSPTPSE